MSIVGNRPLPVYEAELITGDEISKRFLAPPKSQDYGRWN
jgi:hypothetical protein